jgi:hypothetical protein
MLERTITKLKEFWASPYSAPARLPLKNVARFTYTPIKDFVDCIKEALATSKPDEPFLMHLARAVVDDCYSGVQGYPKGYTMAMGWIGMIGGGIGAAVGAGFAAHALGLGWLGIGAAGVAASGLGILAGPFVVAGTVALGGFIAGVAMMAPGFVEGCRSLKRHFTDRKMQGAVAQAVPQLKEAEPDMSQKAGRILEQVMALPENCRGPLLKELAEQYAKTGEDAAEKVLKAVEALPNDQREKVAEKLRDMLSESFSAVAKKEAGQTVVLHKVKMSGGPLKLKSQQAATP